MTTPTGGQRHDFWDEVSIVSGTIHGRKLGEALSAARHADRPPAMAHAPARSPDGCVCFEQRIHQ
jgi:hypothetical protein